MMMSLREAGARLNEALEGLNTLGELPLFPGDLTPEEYATWVELLNRASAALSALHEFVLEIQTRKLRRP